MEIIPNWHPFFVHFAVVLVLVMGAIQLLSWVMPNLFNKLITPSLHKFLVVLTILASLATVSAGFVAYNSVNHDTQSHIAMTGHKHWALATTSIFILASILFFVLSRFKKWLAGSLFVIASVFVLITGYKGSELVYHYGLGVISLPNTDEHDHSSHGHDSQSSHHDNSDGHHQTTSEEPELDENTHVHADGEVHQH